MLARMLAFDKTTLSRSLGLMRRNGWIELATADGHRKHLRLTKDGTKLFAVARPGWRRAQNRLRSAMSDAQWNTMWRLIRDVTNCAYQACEMKGHRTRKWHSSDLLPQLTAPAPGELGIVSGGTVV
jgi:hypothetical protein